MALQKRIHLGSHEELEKTKEKTKVFPRNGSKIFIVRTNNPLIEDRRGRDDDAWHTLFECPAFQLYWEEAMTALEKMGEPPLTPDSLVSIMLKSAEGWDQVAAFVALTMRRKMEIAWERPIVATTQHPMPDLSIPPTRFCRQQPSKEAEDDPGRSTSETSNSQFTT